MSCEEAYNRVRELGSKSAKAHQDYAALVGPPNFMKVLPMTPEESRAIKEAVERCNEVDEALSAAMKAAYKAQH